jgi:hypothetical protein
LREGGRREMEGEGGRKKERERREDRGGREGEREKEATWVKIGKAVDIIISLLLLDGVVFVVRLKDLSDISPRPHHYLVHTTRMV